MRRSGRANDRGHSHAKGPYRQRLQTTVAGRAAAVRAKAD
jgi:hypothetical protein